MHLQLRFQWNAVIPATKERRGAASFAVGERRVVEAVVDKLILELATTRIATAGVEVRHAVFGAGSPIQPFLNNVYRLSDGAQLRSWAQDALEGSDPGAAGIVDGLTPEQQVGRAVLDFLKA
jgi:hypothetical protein